MPIEWPENANQVGSNLFRRKINQDQGKHPDSGRIGGKHDKVWTGQGGELLDQFGFTKDGQLPDGYIAPQYQSLAERQAARRNDRLAREAQLVLDQGLSAMGQYRPGVSQQLTSGLYGQQANAILENRMGAPDLMHYGRQDAVMDAQKHATKMGLINAGAGIISAGVSAGIGALAKTPGAALNIAPNLSYSSGSDASAMAGQGYEPPGPSGPDTGKPGSQGAPTTPGGAAMPSAGQQPGAANVGSGGNAATTGSGGQGGGGQGAGGAGGGSAAGPTTQGGQGAGPGSAGGGGDFGPQSMGGGGALGGGDPSMMAGGGMGGGDSVFQTPVAAATTGMSPVQALSMGTGMNPNDMLDLTLEAEPDLLAEDFNDQAYARVGFLISSDIPYNPLFTV